MDTLILVTLTTYYVTYVLVDSEFPLVERVRVGILSRWSESPWSYITTCVWCMSVYVSGAAVLGTLLLSDRSIRLPALVWLGAAALCGIFHTVVQWVAHLDLLNLHQVMRIQRGEPDGSSELASSRGSDTGRD